MSRDVVIKSGGNVARWGNHGRPQVALWCNCLALSGQGCISRSRVKGDTTKLLQAGALGVVKSTELANKWPSALSLSRHLSCYLQLRSLRLATAALLTGRNLEHLPAARSRGLAFSTRRFLFWGVCRAFDERS